LLQRNISSRVASAGETLARFLSKFCKALAAALAKLNKPCSAIIWGTRRPSSKNQSLLLVDVCAHIMEKELRRRISIHHMSPLADIIKERDHKKLTPSATPFQ
jgi:hypothetical protein